MKLLSDAIKEVEMGKDEGVTCPCCSQFVKRYKRKITSAMAYGLILIHKESKGEWIHLREFFTERNIRTMNDLPTLLHWGLIEKSGEVKEDGNPDSGKYRITQKGRDFANNKIQMPIRCFIFNDTCEGFSDKYTTIIEALSDKFNYSELLPKVESTGQAILL